MLLIWVRRIDAGSGLYPKLPEPSRVRPRGTAPVHPEGLLELAALQLDQDAATRRRRRYPFIS